MSSYRRGRGGRQGQANVTTKGIFVNGVWNCDCSPRLSAVHLQVKKENMNKGRWFYKCQKQQDGQCNFFLWDDDAKPREEHTLLNNLRSRPLHANQATPSKPQSIPEPPPPYTSSISPEQSRKRPRNIVEETDEFAFCHGEDEGFTQELDQVMAAAETPRKVVTTESFTTPARRKLPWTQYNQARQGLQTPQTEHHAVADPLRTRFATAEGSFFTSSKHKESEGKIHEAIMPTSSPLNTPTPIRFKDMSAKDDLVQEVFSLLHDSNVTLSNQAETKLKSVLSRHTRKSEGFRKGQELVRLSLKTKEARISELEYHISLLENERGDHSDY